MVSSSLWSYARNGGLTDRVDGEPSPREDPDGRHLLGHVRVELVRSFVPFQGVQTAPFQIVVALEQGIRTDPHVFRHRHAADPQRPRATCQFKQLVNSFSNCELISISPDGSIDCPLAHTHTHTQTHTHTCSSILIDGNHKFRWYKRSIEIWCYESILWRVEFHPEKRGESRNKNKKQTKTTRNIKLK